AQRATKTLPILGLAEDMVGSGFVASLAKPGGNTTGVSMLPSRPGEVHPEPLTDPDVTLSCDPARATARRLPPSVENLSSSRYRLTLSQPLCHAPLAPRALHPLHP